MGDELMQKQVEELEKQRLEQQQLLKSQSKKLDHMERAKRLEEIPRLQEAYEKHKVEAKEAWELREKERIDKLLEERKNNLCHRDRLARMKSDFNTLINSLDKSRMESYKDKLKEFDTNNAAERKRRLAVRKEKRKIERREKWLIEQEEMKQRIIEEKERQAREKEEAEKAALRKEEEKKEKERERKLADLPSGKKKG